MRSNGLTASAYTPVADLDPRVADALLGELKEQGVAAYAKPVESTSTSGFDRPEFRTDVRDRLYVDAAESERVKAMITEQDPTLATDNDDLTWAQIVAGFDQPVTTPVNPWPATEDLDWSPSGDSSSDSPADTPEGTSDARPDTGPDTGRRDRRADLRGWLAGRDATGSTYDADPTADGATMRTHGDDDVDEPVDRFVPEPPPPLPQLEPWQQLAWVGLIGGPVLFLVSVLFAITLPGWVSLFAAAAFVGGFIALVATLGDRVDPEDDPDNGAVL